MKKDKNLLLRLLQASLLLLVHNAAAEETDYHSQIQPNFDQYCVACHACFDAPCQLNLASAEGLLRGANKTPVYNGTRQEDAPPRGSTSTQTRQPNGGRKAFSLFT